MKNLHRVAMEVVDSSLFTVSRHVCIRTCVCVSDVFGAWCKLCSLFLNRTTYIQWINYYDFTGAERHGVSNYQLFVRQFFNNTVDTTTQHYWPFVIGIYCWPLDHTQDGSVMWKEFPWASYQIRKIAGCACAGNAGNVSPRRRFQRKPLVSDPGMHHGTCVTHVPWCMSGSLTCGDGENVPGIPGACAPAILRIWKEVHGMTF